MEAVGSFSIDRFGRSLLKYVEMDKELTIEVESGGPLAVYLSSARYWKHPDGQLVSEEERIQIAKNLKIGLKFLGIRHEIS